MPPYFLMKAKTKGELKDEIERMRAALQAALIHVDNDSNYELAKEIRHLLEQSE